MQQEWLELAPCARRRRFTRLTIEKTSVNCHTWRLDKEKAALGEGLRSGGQILIDQLVGQGVERVYCVPGESYLAALDAMNNAPIDVTVCRQEAGAAIMALTEGRLSGRPGILLRHARPRRHQRGARAPYRRARFERR